METKEILAFLIKANEAGYGNQDAAVATEADMSHTITFSEGDWSFHDNYFGGEPYGGREVVFHKGKPVWMMVYYGAISDHDEKPDSVYAVLRKALLAYPPELPVRGPERLADGEYEYHNAVTGGFECFSGKEEICHAGRLVYSAGYQGGLVDK